MKAAVFHKPGDISYTTVADPRIELATDINSLPLSEVAQGYKLFDEKSDDCVKVVLKP